MSTADSPPHRPLRRHPRRRRRLLITAGITAAVLAAPAVSYVQALTYPGSAPFATRSVEWVRDNGGGRVVDAAENWWYARHVPAGQTPTVRAGTGSTHVVRTVQVAPPVILGVPQVVGEDQWIPGRSGADGNPALWTTFFRPDAAHPEVIAGAAWIKAGAVAHLVAGTTQPDRGSWPGNARVATTDVPNLLATFNSGFKFKDTPGGFLLQGRSSRPLVDGLATAVIDARGHLDVGRLGSDVTVGPTTLAARQNLQMVVEGGRPVPGLADDAHGAWGTSKNQKQFTWRSGLGVDARGDTVYVAGNGLDLVHLTDALVTAGAVRAMELDMHHGMASFASWQPTDGSGTPTPTKLLPDMSRPADRYLEPDQRDFFYLTVPTTSAG